MIRNLVLILVCLFGFTYTASAQSIDFAFPRDVFGFRFGDPRADALRNCSSGEYYNEFVFVCYHTAQPLGFDGDLYIEFNSSNHVERVWIESNPNGDLVTAQRNFEIFRNDLVSRFGSADMSENTEYHWIFSEVHEEGEISIIFHASDNDHGYFRLMFDTTP